MAEKKMAVLIEINDELRAMVQTIGEYAQGVNHVVMGMYGGNFSISYIAQYGVGQLAQGIRNNAVDAELLAKLEEFYRIHRSAPAQNTNVYFTPIDLRNVDVIVEHLEKAGVRHLYHGEKINRKMIVTLAIAYAHHIALQDQQG